MDLALWPFAVLQNHNTEILKKTYAFKTKERRRRQRSLESAPGSWEVEESEIIVRTGVGHCTLKLGPGGFQKQVVGIREHPRVLECWHCSLKIGGDWGLKQEGWLKVQEREDVQLPLATPCHRTCPFVGPAGGRGWGWEQGLVSEEELWVWNTIGALCQLNFENARDTQSSQGRKVVDGCALGTEKKDTRDL